MTAKGYTDKQNEVIKKMGDLGYSNQAIADRLGRSRQAIEKHRRKLEALALATEALAVVEDEA